MSFNPFNKPLEELNAVDLDTLIKNEVAEGYWVEYKSIFQPAEKIAKSIASFANTYGGWYFIGIEADKVRNIATKICGFELTSVSDPIAKLRESIKSNIDPIPLFHHKLIDLVHGKAVLIVQVPKNQATPFITKDGRIYRRVSDSSDPIPENNRYAIDQLVKSGKELVEQLESFCQDERTFSKSEENQSWVNIYLSPNPIGSIVRGDLITPESAEKLLELSQKPIKSLLTSKEEMGLISNLPFNSVKLGFESITLRQVEQSRIAFNSLTAEFFTDGRAKFHIPLKFLPILDSPGIQRLTSTYVKELLLKILESDKDNSFYLLRFFDIWELSIIGITLLNFYQELYDLMAEQNEVQVVVTMDNTWRLVPFFDIDEWGTHVKKFGLPVQNTDNIRIPNKGQSMILGVPLWIQICPKIALHFGIPTDLWSVIIARPFIQK